MTTQELKKLAKIQKEITVLKSAVIGLVPLDKEGEYKTSFIARMKKLQSQKPISAYSGKGSLLEL
jgi:hypothetical protein